VNLNNYTPKPHSTELFLAKFSFAPMERITKTLEHTTQFTWLDTRLPLRFSAANVSCLNEVFATDTFFFDIPAHDDGIMSHGDTMMLQPFCGYTSLLTAIYPMRSENNIAGTLEEFIKNYSASNALFSDNAKVQTGQAVQEILISIVKHIISISILLNVRSKVN
jgi:hypothetical protein